MDAVMVSVVQTAGWGYGTGILFVVALLLIGSNRR